MANSNKGKGVKNKGLGRGLSDLFADKKFSFLEDDINHNLNSPSNLDDKQPNDQENPKNESEYQKIDIRLIKPCKTQPRKAFDMNLLKELSESIKKNGVLQPILLRNVDEDGYYEIIAGERRWRASLIAAITEIPAIIKNYDDDNVLLVSIIENLQRSDLLPVEELEAYMRLFNKGYTHEEIGSLVNKSRSYISNILRLDALPYEVKEMLNEGKISIGHAKVLLNSPDAEDLANEIISKDLNVRQAEEIIRKLNRNSLRNEEDSLDKNFVKKNNKIYNECKENYQKDQETLELESLISTSFETDVVIEQNFIKFSYKDFEDLDRIINLLISQKVE